MNDLKLFLLGPPRLEREGRSLALNRSRAMALLAYLAVTGERHSREALATLLWPESEPGRGRARLRRELATLNELLGKGWLETDREQLGLTGSAGRQMWLDLAAFQDALAKCQQHGHPINEICPECLQPLREAVALYRGGFLAGFSLPDSPEFDEWQFFQAEEQRQAFASALERLGRILSSQGDYESAIPYARRWLALDLLHEPAHRQLMRLYAWTGQWAAALRQYQECVRVLKQDLDVSPSVETTALFERIRHGGEAEEPPLSLRHLPQHNLPPQPTAFIGREEELTEIQRLLLDEPDCRLLTLVGPGGIGKTRLALATAEQTLNAFPDGAYFVSLAPVGEVEFLIPAIAEALKLTFYGKTDPKDQLLDYLCQKKLLLVVDNFEHLLDGASLLSDILNLAPGVTLLVTSRERLKLQEEWGCEVQGLSFPAVKDEPSQVSMSYSAIQLFLQRARQAGAGFTPSAAEMADIGRICQLVEGMPLGLELAAPWIRTLSCREIALEIQRNLDFLTTWLRNMPERHRSLRVVFEQTWRRLSTAEQSVLRQLSVFRGGCTREAAGQVTGATLPVLSSLVDKALLRRTNTGRYELHELIRQFAETQLQAKPGAVEQAQRRHRDYFIAFLEARTAGVKGTRQKETLVEIRADIDNVRLAWQRVVANRDAQAIERSAECLFVYYLYSSGHYEGQDAFGRAVGAFSESLARVNVSDVSIAEGLAQAGGVSGQQANLVGFLLAGQGYFLARTRDPQAGQILLEQAVSLLRRAEPGDQRKQAFALMWLGWAIQFQGRNAKAQEYVEASLPLLSESGDRWGEVWSLLLWANCTSVGRPTEAEQALTRALAVCRESGDQSTLGYTLHNLGAVATELGQYAQAKQYIDQAIRIFEELDNALGRGYAVMRQGQLAIRQGEYRQAIQSLQQALAYFDEVRTLMNVHWTRIDLGTALRLQGDYSLAEQLYLQSLEAYKVAHHQQGLARCLNGLGCLAYDRGELDQAEQFQREALAILQQLESEAAMVAAGLRHLGQVLVASGGHHHVEAKQHFRQALQLATKHQLAPIALDVGVEAARLLAQSGKTEQAAQLLALAEQHEASTFETREKARHHLAELMNQLPLETVQTTQTRGRTLDWQTAARRLIEALSAEIEQ